MAFLEDVADIFSRVRTNSSKLETFKKGSRFEKFVRDILFSGSKYALVERTHGYWTNEERFIESSRNPDFKFRSLDTGFTFWVEAEYRSGFHGGGITVCEPWKLEQFYKIAEKRPLFFALGVGGPPQAPKNVYLVPFSKGFRNWLHESFLNKYRVPTNKPIVSIDLINSANIIFAKE